MPVPAAPERWSPPRPAAARGVVLAGEYQVPVVEGVERPDDPTAEVDEGNSEATLPSVRPAAPAGQPPPPDVPPDVEQPAEQP